MPDNVGEGAKIAGAVAGTGAVSYLLGLISFQGRFVRKEDCNSNQTKCNQTLHATLKAIQADLLEIKTEQKRFRSDFYAPK